MAVPCFYYPELSSEDTLVELSEGEASHAVRSRRLKVGQAVRLLNGRGLVGEGVIAEAEHRGVSVTLESVLKQERAVSPLTIASAVPKGDRQKVMVDMLTQLGVSEIIPLNCEHSVTRFKPSMHDKWIRVAIESCKQSQNPWLPEIDEGISVLDLVKIAPERLFYADGEGGNIAHERESLVDAIIMIGPEGGFSPSELELFRENNIRPLVLSHYILRTEVAAIAAASQALSKEPLI